MNAITHANDLDTPTTERDDKRFKTLQAQFAMLGQTLQRTEAKDGAVTYFATRWGIARILPTLDHARQLLGQSGGNHDDL